MRQALWVVVVPLLLLPGEVAEGQPSRSGRLAAPGRIGGRTYRGVKVTRRVPFASEPLPEPRPSTGRRPPHVAPWMPGPQVRRRGLPQPGTPETGREGPSSALGASFNGGFIGITDDISTIPPDTMGCVGSSHLVSFLNNDMAIWNKSGTNLYQTSLRQFMTVPLGLQQTSHAAFDPKVLWDPHSQRYIGICLNGPTGNNTKDSAIALAVSQTSDPTGSWYRWAIDADVNGGTTQTNYWADFPGLGVDHSAVYLTANMYLIQAFQYVKVWCIPKQQLLDGSATINWSEFWSLSGGLGTFTVQPCLTYSSTTSEYLASTGWSSFGIEIWRIDDPLGTPTLTNAANPTVATYDYTLADAPQLGGSQLIETNDDRMLDAEYRDGSIWCTHAIDVSDRGSARWYELNASAGTITQQGTVSDTSRSFYFPSIAVNSDGDVALGFSGSSSSEYASAFYTVRDATDAAGYMDPPTLLKAGEAYYYKTYSGTRNRWGDYSATCVDPANDTTFWTLQEYAWTAGVTYDRWSTWWGSFDVTGPAAVVLRDFAADGEPGSVTLRWSTQPAIGVAGFNILRGSTPRGPFVRVNASPVSSPDEGLTADGYSFTDRSAAPGVAHYYKLQMILLDGSVEEYGLASAVALPSGLGASVLKLGWLPQALAGPLIGALEAARG